MASSEVIMWSTTTPAARVAATISSPKESLPTGATRWVGLPSRARFSAMLRPTPPGVLMAAPGLDVRSSIGVVGVGLDVHVRAADHDDGVGLGPDDVAAPEDGALLGEVGQVHRHGGLGGTDAVGDRRGIEQGLGAEQVDDVPLAFGEAHAWNSKGCFVIPSKSVTARGTAEPAAPSGPPGCPKAPSYLLASP